MADYTLEAHVIDMGAAGHFVKLRIVDDETGDDAGVVVLTPSQADRLAIRLQDLAGDAINADRSERRG